MSDNTLPKPVTPAYPSAPMASSGSVPQGTQSPRPFQSTTPVSPTAPLGGANESNIPIRSFSKPVPPSSGVSNFPSASTQFKVTTTPPAAKPFSSTSSTFGPNNSTTVPPVKQTPQPFVAAPAINTVKPAAPPAPAFTAPPSPMGTTAVKAPVGNPSVSNTSAFKIPSSSSTASVGGVPPQSPSSSGKTPVTSQPLNGGAAPRKSIFRFFPFLLLFVFFAALIGGAIYYFFGNKTTSTIPSVTNPVIAKKTITYWGLWEPTDVMAEVLVGFEKENPEYKVVYVQQSYKEYRERLQAEIAKGTGPDVFRFHDSWVPMLKNELSPLPEKIMSTQEFGQTFYPVAQQQLTLNDTIVGIPLMIDGLGLYYNKDIFSIANRTPPKNWEELKKTAQDLTIKSGDKITRGGVALGTTSNVEHFPEIVALLMLQNGANPANPTSPQAIEAMNFYLDFGEKLKVWDTTLPNATTAFAKGDVAMMIAPSWRVHEIKAMNPNLQFDIVPVPQLPDKERTTWASFWAEGVSTQSKEKEASWKLLKYLSSAPVQKKFYSDASKVRAFGELYSRKDLADDLASAQYVGAYIQDAPYAKAWYLNAYTHDNGLNDQIIKYYQDALNKGIGPLSESAKTVQQGMTQVLTQYGLVTAAPAQTQ